MFHALVPVKSPAEIVTGDNNPSFHPNRLVYN